MQEQETWSDFSDSWEGGATIDYWIWRDDRLVPATSTDVASIQQDERPRHTLRRRAVPRVCDLRTARRLRRQRNVLNAPLMGCPPLVIPWLRARGSQRRGVDEEGAHAKRPVTR